MAAGEEKSHGDALERLAQVGTYRTLGEQKLSPQEERFEKARRTIGLFLAPAVFLIFLLLPLDMDGNQQKLAAALLFVIVLWITEAVPIPIGGLLGIALIVLIGVAPVDDVIAPFGSSTIFVFIGAFILAQAMLRHGVARRFAFRMLAMPGVGKSTVRTVITFGLITCLLSAFVSNTATVAMLLPTALAILGTIANLMDDQSDGELDPTKLRVGVALMLMLAYGASVGGLLTPVGSPPNLIGRGLIEEATGEKISFLEWVLAALPICAAMFVALCAILLLLNRPEVKRLEGVEDYVAAERSKMGPQSRKERNTLIAFGVAVTLWIAPGIVAIIAGDESQIYSDVTDRLDEGVVAILAASLLFLLPVNWAKREFTLTWSEAKDIDWGTILLFGSGIIFGCTARRHGPRRDDRHLGCGHVRCQLGAVDHDLRGRARDPDLGDDQQHGERVGGGADRDPGRGGRGCQPVHPRAGGHLRRVVRVHAAGLDAAERDRLRLRRRADHPDGAQRLLLRRDRGDPDRDRDPGPGQRAGHRRLVRHADGAAQERHQWREGAAGGLVAVEEALGRRLLLGEPLDRGEVLAPEVVGVDVILVEGRRHALERLTLRQLDAGLRLRPPVGVLGDRRADGVGGLRVRVPHPAAGEHVARLEVQVQPGRVCLLRALVPEVDAGLRLVGRLVAREARVAVDAEERAALATGVGHQVRADLR